MFSHKLDDRTELRLVEPKHAETLFALIQRNRERLAPWMTFVENCTSIESAVTFARNGLHQFADGLGYHCGIWRDGDLAGVIGMFPVDKRNGSTEIGYWLDASAEGHGIITAACRTILNDMFHNMGLHRVVIRAATANTRSRAVAERLGFRHEGTQRKAVLLQREYLDHEAYALLRDEWTGVPDGRPAMFMYEIDGETSLSLVEPSHAEEQFGLVDRNRAHIGRWLPWVDETHSVMDLKVYHQARLHQFADTGGFNSAIWYQGKLAGAISLNNVRQTRLTPEIGYWLGQEFEGKGLITRSTRVLLDYGFGELGLNRIIIKAEPGNLRSRAVPERLGFRHEGTLRKAAKFRERFVDHELYAMLSEEWRPGLGAGD